MDSLNVMVADDSEISAKRLVAMLGQLGHRVIKRAHSGAEALAAYPSCLPDMVAMDITMPDMDGIEATRRILQAYPDAVIVMVTSHGLEDQVMAAIAAGAKGYLRKPVDADELERLLERLGSEIAFAKPCTQICALMFADVVKSSRITKDTLKTQLHMVIHGRLANIRSRAQVLFDQHTGDGFFICGADATEMAENALEVRDHFLTLDWRAMGYAEAIAIRIALDLDKVTITERDGRIFDVAGSGIDRVARIEPVVTPGEVWCSAHFERQLARENPGTVTSESLGVKELAKDFGRDELYALSWRNGGRRSH